MPKTAIRLLEDGLPFKEVLRLAQLADRRGLDALFFTGGGFLQLAAVAPATERIRLITGVATIYTSSPSQLFQQAVTLDRISGGRAVLGLGTGHVETAVAHGVPFEQPLDRMREYVQTIRGMLEEPSRRFVRHDLQIWVAAMKAGMCRVAGEVGDGALLNWLTPDYAPRAVAAVRAGAEQAGRDPDTVEIATYLRVSAGSSEEETQQEMALDIANYASRPTYRRFFDSLGFGAATAAIVEVYSSSREQAAARVPDAMIEAFAAIGRDASLKRIRLYREMGITMPVLAPVASPRVQDWEAVIDLAGD